MEEEKDQQTCSNEPANSETKVAEKQDLPVKGPKKKLEKGHGRGQNGGGRRPGEPALATKAECQRELSRLYRCLKLPPEFEATESARRARSREKYKPVPSEILAIFEKKIGILKIKMGGLQWDQSQAEKAIAKDILERAAYLEEKVAKFEEQVEKEKKERLQ